jgi:hypothetical protein
MGQAARQCDIVNKRQQLKELIEAAYRTRSGPH